MHPTEIGLKLIALAFLATCILAGIIAVAWRQYFLTNQLDETDSSE
jgi:hypothetical protein